MLNMEEIKRMQEKQAEIIRSEEEKLMNPIRQALLK